MKNISDVYFTRAKPEDNTMKVIACYNIKGGVGKTASAVNLSYLSAWEGNSTLVWDLDPQGASSFYFRIKPKVKGGARGILRRKRVLDDVIKATDYDQLDLIPADFSYRNMDLALEQFSKSSTRLRSLIEPVQADYDYLFLDCPPNISLVSENVFQAADVVLVPTIPTTLSIRTLYQLLRFCDKRKYRHLKILPFFSMADRRKILHRGMLEDPPRTKSGFLASDIPYASEVEQMGGKRAPLATYAHNSRIANAYRSLWRELKSQMDHPPT
jgi:cellulose biosynthesis protein BcsQ